MTGRRILAVDNNPFVLTFLDDWLTLAGYEVDTASNGREALEKIERAAYDLIISDVRMPELDGPGLCRVLARRGEDSLARLLFLTTPHSFEDHRGFLAQSGVPVLTKPIGVDELRAVVDEMTSRITEPAPA